MHLFFSFILFVGVIHGDFHDWNLIVDWDSSSCSTSDVTSNVARATDPPDTAPTTTTTTDLASCMLASDITVHTVNKRCITHVDFDRIKKKYGIIDFEEVSCSYPVLELCRLVADCMVECIHPDVDWKEVGGHVIAGYAIVNREPVQQYGKYLHNTVLGCLAQYVVLQTCEFEAQGGTNLYCLEGTEEAKVVINKMKGVTSDDLYKVWGDVLEKYGLSGNSVLGE
jgi:hypothetical protein